MNYRTYGIVLISAATLALTACAGAPAKYQTDETIDTSIKRAGYTPLETYAQAYAARPDDPQAAYNYAYLLREEGRLEEALEILEPAAKKKSTPVEVVNEYGNALLADGQYRRAESVANTVIKQLPENGEGYHILGIALDAQAKHEPAEDAFRKALEYWQGDPVPVMNNLALNLTAQGYLDEAASLLREAKQIDPDRREIERNLRIVNTLREQITSK